MAGTPRWKIFNSAGEYIAATKHVEDAAILVAANGDGSTIRDGHSKADIRWTEGAEAFAAGESYDRVHTLVMQRCDEKRAAAEAKRLAYGSTTIGEELARRHGK